MATVLRAGASVPTIRFLVLAAALVGITAASPPVAMADPPSVAFIPYDGPPEGGYGTWTYIWHGGANPTTTPPSQTMGIAVGVTVHNAYPGDVVYVDIWSPDANNWVPMHHSALRTAGRRVEGSWTAWTTDDAVEECSLRFSHTATGPWGTDCWNGADQYFRAYMIDEFFNVIGYDEFVLAY